MSPVADYNLEEYLNLKPLTIEKRSILRTFFGCLTGALKYLHENRIRHKDVKPQVGILLEIHCTLIMTTAERPREGQPCSVNGFRY